jgi:HEAT repeat protein
VRANWRNMGFLLERGEIAHRYRSRLLDMLSLLGPAAVDAAQPELVARLSDPEERSRWAAAGALDRFDSPAARQRAAAFFAQNVPALVDRYRVDPSRRLRTCLFLLRAELKDPDVRTLALAALDDHDVRVGSCGAFLLLTSGVPTEVAEERLLGALGRHGNHYARDSFAAALEILATPHAEQALRAHTPWEPERVQTIRERWNDPYFRLFGDLL